ncbi:hypothetical protein B0H67DRAFT_481503 [Lasiosphaeris hirsuta]|uniref:CRAL-TRIO domain-containing protein n=1 Tax=Lasiosphaeris hirsuta TaxID=260670 RepID=A0AA40E512_9PEZI|nr:hypothetical protein B0H67DRAFT_481503 [Lasiosphaeris hirsuta]
MRPSQFVVARLRFSSTILSTRGSFANPNFLLGCARLWPTDRVSYSVSSASASGILGRGLSHLRSGASKGRRTQQTCTTGSTGFRLAGQFRRLHSTRVLTASSSNFVSLACIFGIGFGIGFSALVGLRHLRVSSKVPNNSDGSASIDNMSAEIAPGRSGNLTPEQEEKLRQLWKLVFQVCSVAQPENGSEQTAAPVPVAAEKEEVKSKKTGRLSIFSRRGRKESEPEPAPTAPTGPTPSVILTSTKDGDEDKYGQLKHFHETLASQSPESIRTTIWSMVKHDHPDALVLRFLRARKWDVEKALIMLVSTMNWRAQDMSVDDDIMKNGEGAAAEAEKNDSDPAAKRLAHDFLAQARMGKSFLHGVDKSGRPICHVRVRLHKQGEQIEESLERYTVYLIETCRMVLQPPVDTATIVFDMTGFSMANMDYSPVKFMIKCFEANYPESLGAVLVHKSPWLFQAGIWKVIRGWLDPVVANKVHFTNNVKEMEEFIARSQIPKDLDGEEDWEFSYVEPVTGENDRMKDTATRDRLVAARALLVKEYEEATLQWIQHPEGEKGAEIKARRAALASRLRDDYWVVDPYLRARSYYDRIGVLQPGGKIDFYPLAKKEVEVEKVAEKVNGAAAATAPIVVPVVVPTAETSADDVD